MTRDIADWVCLQAFANSAWLVNTSDGTPVCDVHNSAGNAEANAHLIAASPGLLAALKIARKWMPRIAIEPDGEAAVEVAFVDAMLAKATGESQ